MAEENPIYNPGSPAKALEAATAPLPKPDKPEPETPQPPKVDEHKSSLKTLRTFQGDVQEAVGKGGVSMTTIALAEQKRKTLRPDLEAPTDHEHIQHKLFLIIGGLLLVLGLTTVGAVYYNSKKNSAPVAVVSDSNTPIVFTKEIDVPTASSTRPDLLGQLISNKLSFNLPVNSILYLNTTESGTKPLVVQNMLQLLAPQIPDTLARSFDSTYMIGIYSFDTNEPFIILTTSDFGSTYAGMLKWEATMPYDLGRLFNLPKMSSTTMTFEDESLRNKDMRVLKDDKRQTILLYSFIDKNTVVITSHENILAGIIGKYITGKMSR